MASIRHLWICTEVQSFFPTVGKLFEILSALGFLLNATVVSKETWGLFRCCYCCCWMGDVYLLGDVNICIRRAFGRHFSPFFFSISLSLSLSLSLSRFLFNRFDAGDALGAPSEIHSICITAMKVQFQRLKSLFFLFVCSFVLFCFIVLIQTTLLRMNNGADWLAARWGVSWT